MYALKRDADRTSFRAPLRPRSLATSWPAIVEESRRVGHEATQTAMFGEEA